ncbi:flavin reductase family protein [Dyella telluris]|uniref:Flavin reductase family protein n=1 Tax=Dyella telluris TaxID=2763498 RepID=A0A7G8Q8F6_9GAMM|nr:flavin reductase family protein [Dyella telluris]QNK03064.1 flavin reductase family protein [Dyella telluris]
MDMHRYPDTRVIRPSILYFGTPVVLITTRNPDGTINITPMSSAWALADRVVIGLAGGGQGLANLHRERECVLNFASEAMHHGVERIAPTTGCQPVPGWKQANGYRHEPDKFALGGWHALPSLSVQPPRIRECPLQMEARVMLDIERPLDAWRDGAGGYTIIELEVLHVHAHDDVTVPDTQHVDPQRYRPLFYLFRHYVGPGKPLGRTFKAEV